MDIFLDDVLRAIGEEDASSTFPLPMKLEPYAPQADDPDLSEESVRRVIELTGTCEEKGAVLLDAAKFLKSNDMYRLAVIYFYRATVTIPIGPNGRSYIKFSSLDPVMAGALRKLVKFMTAVPIEKWHREKGVPEDISRDTLRLLGCNEKTDFTTILKSPDDYQLNQMLDPELCNLIIGRFAFLSQRIKFIHSFVYRHENGSYLGFVTPGLAFDKNGLAANSKEEALDNGGCVTSFKVENGYFIGNTFDERGRVSTKLEKIPTKGYKIFLSTATKVLDMHIPAGGGMTPHLTQDSFKKAKAFYQWYFGDRCPKSILCWSWICSPVMEDMLPPYANLVKFAKSVRRMPAAIASDTVPDFVHTGTSLYNHLQDYIDKGNKFIYGAMFQPLDEL